MVAVDCWSGRGKINFMNCNVRASKSYSTNAIMVSVLLFAIGVLLAFVSGPSAGFFIQEDEMQTYLLLAVLTLVLFVPPIIKSNKPGADIFEPFYVIVIVYFFHFILKPLDNLFLGQWLAAIQKCNLIDLNRNIFYAIVGLFSFYWGYFSLAGKVFSRGIVSKIMPFQSSRLSVNNARLNNLAICFGIVGFISFVYYASFYGGIQSLLNEMNYAVTDTRGFGPLLMVVRMFPILASILFYTANINKMNWWKYLVLFMLVFIVFLVSWQRMKIIAMVVGLIFVRHAIKKKIKFNFLKFVVGSVFLVIFFILLSEAFVVYRSVGLADFSIDKLPPTHEIYIHEAMRTFNPTESFTIIARDVPTVLSFQYGKTYSDIFILFIPRFFWPGKPLNIGANGIFSEEFFYEQYVVKDTVFTTTILGEGFINFGLVGIIISMVACGVFLRGVWIYYQKDPTSKLRIIMYSALFGHMPILIRSGFYTYFSELIQLGVPLVLSLYFVIRKKAIPDVSLALSDKV